MELRSKGANKSSVSEEEPLDQQTTKTHLRKKDTVALAVRIRPRTKANRNGRERSLQSAETPSKLREDEGAATPRIRATQLWKKATRSESETAERIARVYRRLL